MYKEQAVEAAERNLHAVIARAQKGFAFASEIADVVNSLKLALRAELARPLEVAAPVGLSGEAWSAVTGRCFDTGGNSACAEVSASRCTVCPNRAASRVPVASVAVDKADWLQESSYRAGAKAGYNLGINENQEGLQALLAAHKYPRPTPVPCGDKYFGTQRGH